MKIIYLASHTALLNQENVIYQDINGLRDIGGDMLSVNLNDYDFLIATPPCNYYSRANYRRDNSEYSLKTKHLLPEIIKKFEKTGKPFIVENVINKTLMRDIINNFSGFYYEHGRHSYFTNIMLDFRHLKQKKYNVQMTSRSLRQGGFDVNTVFDYVIDYYRGLL